MKPKYLYCESCEMFFDNYKYETLEDAGHQDCKIRELTAEEIENCEKDCEEIECEA